CDKPRDARAPGGNDLTEGCRGSSSANATRARSRGTTPNESPGSVDLWLRMAGNLRRVGDHHPLATKLSAPLQPRASARAARKPVQRVSAGPSRDPSEREQR